jgi:hypothetical protein
MGRQKVCTRDLDILESEALQEPTQGLRAIVDKVGRRVAASPTAGIGNRLEAAGVGGGDDNECLGNDCALIEQAR